MTEINKFTQELIEELKKPKTAKGYSVLNLKFNPFPSAGLPRFFSLSPLDENINKRINHFIKSTYLSTKESEYAGLTIVGDFGMGKTHLMKYIIEQINILNKISLEKHNINFSAITCFIDKPEETPQSVIHKIVEQIGIDNIRKYIGRIILDHFREDKEAFYDNYKPKFNLFSGTKHDWMVMFNEPIASNYLEFLKKFNQLGGDFKTLQEHIRNIIKQKIIHDSTLADRYLDLVFDEKKADASWDILAGYVNSRNIQKKEIIFLNSIVKILEHVGFKQLYVFVDEFEDISKLKSAKLSNYLITLNTLINQEKKWALVVSLTPEAIRKIKEESAPLHDRLTSYKINLNHLDAKKGFALLINYLNLAREKQVDDFSPFTEAAVKMMLRLSKGNYRSFILLAHKAVQVASQNNVNIIDNETINEAKELRYDEE